jgi:hypothetical protein
VARTADSKLVLVVDPDDDIGCLEQLRRLHARPYGQILCEHDPTATSAELARYLLAALGKETSGLPRGELWALVDCHLPAERVREIVVARAQTLTYSALRDLADHAQRASTTVWLLTAGERPTAPVTQLLEARPHEHATIGQLIQRWSEIAPPPEPDPVPPGAGRDYPYLTYRTAASAATRARLCAGLPAAERATVTKTWRTAETWIIEWVGSHPRCTTLELADALYRLTGAGDTASERRTPARLSVWCRRPSRTANPRPLCTSHGRAHQRMTKPDPRTYIDQPCAVSGAASAQCRRVPERSDQRQLERRSVADLCTGANGAIVSFR